MGFARQEYWSGLPCPSPGALPHPGMDPASLMSPALAGRFFTTSTTWEVQGPFIPSSNSTLQRFCWTSIFQLQCTYRTSWGIQIKCRSLFSRFEYIPGTFCLSNRLQCFASSGHTFSSKSLVIQNNQNVLFLIHLNEFFSQILGYCL